ncbi:MAG: YwiC-like family protein [Deltaproteobacteria bacterium]|nr:YwiC-like family protein [Deltaproteobacteria bacterium]
MPKKHGAWAALATALLLGLWSKAALRVEVLLFVVAAVAAFVLHHYLGLWLRPRAGGRPSGVPVGALGAGAVAMLAGFGAAFLSQRSAVLWICGAGAALVGLSLAMERLRLDRTLWGEIVGMVGLTLTLPATAYVVARGPPSVEAWLAWAYAAMFFCGSVFRVRLLVRERKALAAGLRARLLAGSPGALVHLLMLAAAAWLATRAGVTWLAAASLVPTVLFAVVVLVRPPSRPIPIRHVGYLELGENVVFLLILLAFLP